MENSYLNMTHIQYQQNVSTNVLFSNASSEPIICSVEQVIPIEAIIGVVLGTTGVLFNLMSLVAISHASTKLSTHIRLIVSLACSDIITGVTVMLMLLHKTINPSYQPGCASSDVTIRATCMYASIRAANTMSLIVCLLNLIGMAIDHYIAILKPFAYHRLLSKKRGTVIIVIIWLIGVILGFSDFIFTFSDMPDRFKGTKLHFCKKVLLTEYTEEYFTFSLTFIAYVTIVYSYVKIYRCVKTLQFRDTEIFLGSAIGSPAKMKKPAYITRSRKALLTTLLIIGAFTVCWLPLCVYELVLLIIAKVNPMVLIPHIGRLQQTNSYLYSLVLINVLVDPIIYAIRIKDIRRGYYIVFKRVQNFLKLVQFQKS